jgi:hypothetical protein
MSFDPASPRTSTSPSGGPSASPSSSPSASSSRLRARSQTPCRMRASRFADISADRHGRSGISTFFSFSNIDAPFAPGAIAIASALASQRFLCQSDGLRLDAVKARYGVSHAGHPSGHPCGRPSGHPSGRLALWPKGELSRAHCGFARFSLADISTSQQARCRSWMRLRRLRVFFAAHPGARPSPPRWLRSALPGEPRRQQLAPLGAART